MRMTKRAGLRLTAMIPFVLALTACGQERPTIALPPVELTTCADEPVAPSLPGRDQQDTRDAMMLDYVLAWRSAWGSCRAAVDGLREWRETAGR